MGNKRSSARRSSHPVALRIAGRDWRVEYQSPEEMTARVCADDPDASTDATYLGYWNSRDRTIWIDATQTPGGMLESFLHEACEIIGHELDFHHITPSTAGRHREIRLLC